MSVPENVISWRRSLKSGFQFLSKAACIAGTFGVLNLAEKGLREQPNRAHAARVLAVSHAESGSFIFGRRTYDITNGWGGRHPVNGVPVFVLTHKPPPSLKKQTPRQGCSGAFFA
jgi:hypothetical protein